MSVPPIRRPTYSQSTSKGQPEDTDEKNEGKEFKLRPKKQNVEEKDEEPTKPKHKSLFDLADYEAAIKERQPNISHGKEEEAVVTKSTQAIDQAEQVKQIGQLIHNMVETLHIGHVVGKTYASMDLKTSPDVPPAFAGSNLTVSFQENGIVIHFDNFMTPQQQNEAITLVEKNKEQLKDMMQALSEKNLQVAALSIGEHAIALPRVTPPPSFLQPTPLDKQETGQQNKQGGGEKEKEDKSKRGPR